MFAPGVCRATTASAWVRKSDEVAGGEGPRKRQHLEHRDAGAQLALDRMGQAAREIERLARGTLRSAR